MTADEQDGLWQVAECLVPGMTTAVAEAMTERVRSALASDPRRHRVSFLGSLLMPEDEVLLCLFAGSEIEVRAISERAGLPFERIIGCLGLGGGFATWT